MSPLFSTFEYSQLRIAKKKAAINKFAWNFRIGLSEMLACSWRNRRCLGVMAGSLLTAGSIFDQALNMDDIVGSRTSWRSSR